MPDPRDTAALPPVGVVPPDGRAPHRMPSSPPPALPAPLPAPVREPAIPDPSRPPAPVARRLPEHKGKVARIGDALTGLSEDLREWVELRIALVQTEIMEQVEFRVAQGKMGAAVGLFAALGAFFLLVTLALGLGWWLGHPFWGFLIVTLLLIAVAVMSFLVLKPTPPPSDRPKKTS